MAISFTDQVTAFLAEVKRKHAELLKEVTAQLKDEQRK